MRTLTATALAALLAVTPLASAQTALESCPETSPPTGWTGARLESDTVRDGVTYDPTGAALELDRAAGLFRSTALGISDLTVFASVADFDRDGWDDFVGVGEATSFVRIYRNRTFENPEPDWDDPSAVRQPKFVMARELLPAHEDHRWRPTVAGDFNGDGWPDVFHSRATTYARPDAAVIWLNRGANDAAGNPTFHGYYSAMASGQSPTYIGAQTWGGTNIQAVDYNGDRKLDLLIGSGENGGSVRIFLNNCTLMSPQPQPLPPAGQPLRCANDPRFVYAGNLITGLGFTGAANVAVFAYGTINADAYPDLVVGSPSCCSNASLRLRYFPGVAGGGFGAAQAITFPGAATSILLADYSQDGRPDLIATTDNWNYNSGNGGVSDYFVNNGTDTPFASGRTQRITSTNNPTYDFDVGFVFDYDHDPLRTPDVMVADGNHTSSFYVLANRYVNQYVDCGEAASGTIDLGELEESEMVVTAARIDPQVALHGGRARFWLSNEDPPNWVEATDCGDGSGELCATFPRGAGRTVRWKAELCSNAAHTETPVITGIEARFDYAEATEHYRAGVVVHDGVSYVGAFKQPGDRGKFYAINAGLDRTYWEVGDQLDNDQSDGERRIYTAHRDTAERLDFTTANATDVGLQDTLGVSDATQAAQVISWVRSPRFGVGNAGIASSKLGAVVTSTPAVLSRPSLPTWYVFASADQRARVDEFLQAQRDRWGLVLFGSKDGMVHAVHTRPTDITHDKNGEEAWAYVPPEVAAGFLGDYTASLGGTLTVTSYPDGSPTLADVADGDGHLSTVAIVAGGNGGKSISVLDVTETVDSETEAVLGPTPLWSAVPGDDAAGQAFSKVAIARVRLAGGARFIAIAATGVDFADTAPPYERGRTVVAYDVLTGEPLWKFEAECPVTTDITVFETDDELEPGGPSIDGYVDRAVFGDRCGNLYKLDPARELGGGWNLNAGMGPLSYAIDDAGTTVTFTKLFATAATAGALGEETPIAGTVGAQIEAGTNRMVVFFGTGGLESHPVERANAFYGVYADDGAIRATIEGACTDGRCEKFYGGVVVTQELVIFTRTVDPEVGSGTCDRGASTVEAVSLNNVEDGDFVNQFTAEVGSAVMGALYGDAGAIYFATLGGSVTRIGEPRAPEAGGDSGGAGAGTGAGTGDEGTGTWDPETPMTLMGWRQVY